MAGWRHKRVAAMIHREVVERLQREVKDPDLEPISVTRVEVTRDLGRARIWYLPLGGGPIPGRLVEALSRTANQLRGPIGRALRLRTAPELQFLHDEQLEAIEHVHALIREVSRERTLEGSEE